MDTAPNTDNRTPNHLANWGTGQDRVHLASVHTGCCVGCKKKVYVWSSNDHEANMTVDEVKATDFGLCSFVSNFWLDRMTN
jgi:hypothetical protein